MENIKQKLFATIYKIATDLVHTGHISEWDFKSYIIGAMFYRYISENFAHFADDYLKDSAVFKNVDFAKYQYLRDDVVLKFKDRFIAKKGFFILPSMLFSNVLKNIEDKNEEKNLHLRLKNIFDFIEKNASCKGLFEDFDVGNKFIGDSVHKRNKVLIELLKGVEKMPLFFDGYDLFGDAYEYLMGMYAANAGKKGGQYFTPSNVSYLLSRLCIIGKKSVNKVYDPACGSGSLLLKVIKILGAKNVKHGFYGQEIDLTTFNLCRMNMFLHNIDSKRFSILHGNTLTEPLHKRDAPFDLIVSNPPFSIPWDNDIKMLQDERYAAAKALAPSSRGDMSFILHCLYNLSFDGVASIVCFPGILYRRGAEKKIRKYLVDNNFIDCIIALPQKLFLNVDISTIVLILKKCKKDDCILFLNASNEFVKNVKFNRNRMDLEHIDRIISIVQKRKNTQNAHLVKNDEVAKNDYNLSVFTYINTIDESKNINIDEVNENLQNCVKEQEILRQKIAEIIDKIK